MWASRQFALGFILAFATYKKSAPMLALAWIFFLVMMAGDLAIGISQKNNGLVISALVMLIISATLVWVINRKK
jgi:hypothetical protein